MILFTIGVVEMIIIAYWTKTVVDSKIFLSGFVTIINIFIWYYVLQTFVDDISNWTLVIPYAVGCAVGTMIPSIISKGHSSRKRKLKNIKEKQILTKFEVKSFLTE